MTPEIKGLFLSGGLSQRMGSDKALLHYGAEPEIRRWQAVFGGLGVDLVWSMRPGQYGSDQFPDIQRIEDRTPGAGPLAAVVSAHRKFLESAWLVLACDWPLLVAKDLEILLARRNVEKDATAFMVGGRREPLCTIYEPRFFQGYDAEEQSLYRLLSRAQVEEIIPNDPERFLNANDAISRHQASQNLLHQSDR